MISLVGCGGGNNSTTDTKITTGTGYYVDAAVKGVSYQCGSKSGITDKNGKFIFEKGKECTFTLAGVPLRTTKAEELADGKKVIENNPKVAKLLQSIDADGDLTNGIQITDKVLTALTRALKAAQITDKVPEGAKLTEVVASVGHDVEGVSGDVKSDTEVEQHLTQTQTEITKALLTGKTFYTVGAEGPSQQVVLVKTVFNKEVTSLKLFKLDGTFDRDIPIEIHGNKMFMIGSTDGSYILLHQKAGYILANDYLSNGKKDGQGHRLYDSQNDAQAYYDSLQNTGVIK